MLNSYEKIQELESKIDIRFKNTDLLIEALTHRSFLNERPDWHVNHNERLEFLGDAVLEIIVTEFLFLKYKEPEGVLTSWRAALVNAQMLMKVSQKFDLNKYILLSKGEAKDEGRARQYILANGVESLIGAIYLDQGHDKTKEFIAKFILVELSKVIEMELYKDAKSLFQELAQEKVSITPTYDVLDERGPDHSKTFRIGVYLGKELIGTGEGLSKQEAQQRAAENA